MPHPAHTLRQTFRGSIGGIQDASFGFSYRYENATSGGSIPSARAVVDGLADSASGMHGYEDTFFQALTSKFANNFRFTSVLYQAYGENPAVPAENMHAENQVGGGPLLLPPEVACVVSLRTAVTSRSTRGRVFLPLQGMSLDGVNGIFEVASASTVATAVQAFLQSVKGHTFLEAGGSLEYSLIPTVVSTTHQSTQDITSLRVDTKPDVQRKRQHHVPYQIITKPI